VNSEQEKALRDGADAAIAGLIRELQTRGDELTELSVERAKTLGVAEYGDSSYSLSFDAVGLEVDMELTDAIFYQHLKGLF
jgi:hypothetical protein